MTCLSITDNCWKINNANDSSYYIINGIQANITVPVKAPSNHL